MAKTVSFKKGDIIFKQGASEDFMYDILHGRVGIYTDWGKSSETELAVVQNEFIGDMGLINNRKRMATAVALTDCEMNIITSESLEDYLDLNPEKAIALIHQLYRRLAQTDSELLESCKVISDFIDAENKMEEKTGLFEKMKKLAGLIK